MLSVIRDENEVDGDAFCFLEQIFGQLFGEVTAGGKNGLDAAKGTKQDIDEDSVCTF